MKSLVNLLKIFWQQLGLGWKIILALVGIWAGLVQIGILPPMKPIIPPSTPIPAVSLSPSPTIVTTFSTSEVVPTPFPTVPLATSVPSDFYSVEDYQTDVFATITASASTQTMVPGIKPTLPSVNALQTEFFQTATQNAK
jgi:hypothetical protein